jgi:hypothetical protein
MMLKGGARIAQKVLGGDPGVLGEMVGCLDEVLVRLDAQDKTDEGWVKIDV